MNGVQIAYSIISIIRIAVADVSPLFKLCLSLSISLSGFQYIFSGKFWIRYIRIRIF